MSTLKTKKEKVPRLTQRRYEKWLEALRSGDYKQGNSVLLKKEDVWDEELDDYRESGQNLYCCLGVLGCVLGLSNTRIFDEGMLTDIYGDPLEDHMCESQDCVCPTEESVPFLQNDVWQEELASLNDSGKSFKFIAKKLETKKWKTRLGVE